MLFCFIDEKPLIPTPKEIKFDISTEGTIDKSHIKDLSTL